LSGENDILVEAEAGQELYPESIKQIAVSDSVKGGPDGPCNLQAKQLALRTQFLKAKSDADSKRIDNIEKQLDWFTPRVQIMDMSATGTIFQFDIPGINFRVTLNKTSTSNVSLGVSSITGTNTADIKKLAFYDNGIDNAAFDAIALTTDVKVIDSTIYLATRDNPQMEVWVGAQCWKVDVMISGSSAERVRVFAFPITGIPETA
jgi:hypothetical protein